MVPNRSTPLILISRMGSTRETIMTLPVVNALREHFPDAYIAWSTEKDSSQVVRTHSALDQTIELKRGWFRSPTLLRQTAKELRSYQFDIAIDCQGVTKSAFAGWLSKAPTRVGFGGQYGRQLSCALNTTLIQPVFTHLTDRSLELLIALEIHSPKVRWDFPISESARTWAQRWRRAIPDSRLAIVNPGARWESKRWECDRFAATARYIADRYGYRSVITWGNEVERQLAQTIVFQAKGAASLAPDTDLQHLAALIERADLFLGPDSAPLHLATAVATPTIGLFGATRPAKSRPYGQIAIAKAYEGGSRRHRSKAGNEAMQQIEVDHVCRAIDELESKRQLRKAG